MRLEVAGQRCEGVSTDTRTLRSGQAFVALTGPNHDGHDHVVEAFRRGAAAAVVAREVAGVEGAQLVTPDPLAWLQQTAARVRTEFQGRVVAITGSAGKTTTKDAAAEALSAAIRTGKSSGNFNNHIGLPLSVLNLSEADEAAVLEIGMNHGGEIRALAAIARPEVGVVTNVGTAHIENFDSVEGVAAAKRELVEALPSSGVAILNGDDERVRRFADVHGGRTVFYGTREGVEVRAEDVVYEAAGVQFRIAGEGRFQCSLPARGGLSAALAALAIAREFGVPLQDAGRALAAMKPPKMRCERMERDGLVIWNDCYNSNPEAAEMMLDLLAATPAERRIAVLGEMLELGRWSESLHRGVGVHAARCGLSVLVGIRGAAKHLVDAARGAGLGAGAAIFFEDPNAAGRWLRSVTRPGDALLFKGSRGVRVELALEAFLD